MTCLITHIKQTYVYIYIYIYIYIYNLILIYDTTFPNGDQLYSCTIHLSLTGRTMYKLIQLGCFWIFHSILIPIQWKSNPIKPVLCFSSILIKTCQLNNSKLRPSCHKTKTKTRVECISFASTTQVGGDPPNVQIHTMRPSQRECSSIAFSHLTHGVRAKLDC